MNDKVSKAEVIDTSQPIEAGDKTCGIVMPISAIDGCNESHWTEVATILSDAIDQAGFRPNIVSNADEVGIIQKRIVQNLYDNPIVVCDVSGKNPNVMFELGMRLAFDKPTIIVKDDKTDYSFDTAPIEHLDYPRDLRFSRIVKFKEDLAEKIKLTYKASRDNPKYTTFLKHFGEFRIAGLEKTEVSQQEFINGELASIKEYLQTLVVQGRVPRGINKYARRYAGDVCLMDSSEEVRTKLLKYARTNPEIDRADLELRGRHYHLVFRTTDDCSVPPSEVEEQIKGRLQRFLTLERVMLRKSNVDGESSSA